MILTHSKLTRLIRESLENQNEMLVALIENLYEIASNYYYKKDLLEDKDFIMQLKQIVKMTANMRDVEFNKFITSITDRLDKSDEQFNIESLLRFYRRAFQVNVDLSDKIFDEIDDSMLTLRNEIKNELMNDTKNIELIRSIAEHTIDLIYNTRLLFTTSDELYSLFHVLKRFPSYVESEADNITVAIIDLLYTREYLHLGTRTSSEIIEFAFGLEDEEEQDIGF